MLDSNRDGRFKLTARDRGVGCWSEEEQGGECWCTQDIQKNVGPLTTGFTEQHGNIFSAPCCFFWLQDKYVLLFFAILFTRQRNNTPEFKVMRDRLLCFLLFLREVYINMTALNTKHRCTVQGHLGAQTEGTDSILLNFNSFCTLREPTNHNYNW